MEPDSNSEIYLSSNISEDLINVKLEDFPLAVIKSEANEELWDVTTLKNEVEDEVITGDCGVCQARVEQFNRQPGNCVGEGDCSSSSSSIDLVEHYCNQIEKSYVCDIHKKHFTHSMYLAACQCTQNRANSCSCVTCNENVSDDCDLPMHQQTQTAKNQFSCDMCSKGFAQRGYLIKHKRTHSGERPYICKLCNKRFTQSGSFTAHKRTHTGERPYNCDTCNKGFLENAALSKHRRIHTGEKS